MAALAAAGPRAEAVVWDREPDRRSSFFTQIQRHVKRVDGQAQEFRLPNPATAAQWLLEQARQRGGAVTPEGAQLLVERVGTDRWALSAELDRLLLVTAAVSAETVRTEVAPKAAAEIFGMLEALSRGQRAAALRSTQALLARGESEFYVLSMLAYQFRTLHAIRRGLDRGFTERQIVEASGLKPFVVQKNSRHAGRFSAVYLREALARILATDFAIRRGRVDQRTALLMLALTLASGPRD